MPELTAEQMAHRWVELYGDGTPDSYGSDRYLDLYADDVDWRSMPMPFDPEGTTGDLAILRKATAANRSVLRNRKATLIEVVAEGDRAVFRYLWEATVGVDGGAAPRGTVTRAEVACFLTVKKGKIVRQYDFLSVLPTT